MDNRRLLIGIVCFVGSFALIKVGLMTSILGPVTGPLDLRALWLGFAPAQRIFVIGCFVASAWGVGIILDSLVGLFRKK